MIDTNSSKDLEKLEMEAKLKGSLLLFIQVFFPLLTGRDFILSNPDGRESHFITVCRALTKCTKLESLRLIINVPPGHGKSVMVSFWVAWCLAKFPDSNFLYISYSKTLAAKHTDTIKRIMMLKEYKELFDVHLREDSQAKDAFKTTAGGSVAAFGAQGSITGQDAGLPGLDRFSGCVIVDDAHKPDEVSSDLVRESVITNFRETIQQRPRGINVPIVFIGQRLHEQDLPAYLLSGEDGYDWDNVVLKSIDEAGNALYPEAFPLEMLKIRQDKDRYVFAAQHQQDPQPAGGGLYTPEDFPLLEEEPEFIATFITADTAETEDMRNDASVFSFWGLYEIETMGRKTGIYAVHWIKCREMRVEPKKLESEFLDFWQDCVRHHMPPQTAYIEKKSTGVTLISILKNMRGLKIREIERTRKSGSKSQRFIDIQPYIANKQLSLPKYGEHTQMCVDHMKKITNNDSHAFDDICFVAGTMISTPYGEKPIEDIKVGDKVITPFGTGTVSASGLTQSGATVIKKLGLKGTPSHPIFENSRFLPLDTVADDAKINILSFEEILKWRYKKLLFLMESNTALWGRKGIILASRKIIKKGKVRKDFMLQFGNFIAERKFQKAMLFIIKMATLLITTLATWNVYRISNTCKSIEKKNLITQNLNKIKKIFKKHKKLPKNGTQVKKEGHGIGKMLKRAFLNLKTIFAKDAASNTHAQTVGKATFALARATEGGEEEICQKLLLNANGVTSNFKQKKPPASIDKENFAQGFVQHKQLKADVYNITVEEHGVYYANGVLVSNCDTASDAVKIALIDKILYACNYGNSNANKSARIAAHQLNKINELKRRAHRQRT